jgi:hypothetical protein
LETKYLYTDGKSIYYVQRVNSGRQKYRIAKETPTSPLTSKLHKVTNKFFNTAEEAQIWLDDFAKHKDLEPCLPF